MNDVFSNLADNLCDECDGEGIVSYATGEDSEDLPCQKCFPNASFEDFRDDDSDD